MHGKIIIEINCGNSAAITYAFGHMLEALSKQTLDDWTIKYIPGEYS